MPLHKDEQDLHPYHKANSPFFIKGWREMEFFSFVSSSTKAIETPGCVVFKTYWMKEWTEWKGEGTSLEYNSSWEDPKICVGVDTGGTTLNHAAQSDFTHSTIWIRTRQVFLLCDCNKIW
jgi:hypothetical protein